MANRNDLLEANMAWLYLVTAVPGVLVLLANGASNLVNAFFLGNYVGSEALSAVTLVFPVQMMILAGASLISSGMASVLARALGANNARVANTVFSHALLLALVLSLAGIAGFYWGGAGLIKVMVGDLPQVAALSYLYISILVYASPIFAVLVINVDALRSEGKIRLMSVCMLLSTILNILFDYIGFVWLQGGMAVAAWSTVLAQLVSLLLLVYYRHRGVSSLRIQFAGARALRLHVAEILPLGLSLSLAHVGVALQVAMVNHTLKLWGGGDAVLMVAAYGIAVRLLTFAGLPLIGLTAAFQTILGNNAGASLPGRVNQAVCVGLLIALCYCLLIKVIFLLAADLITP